MTKREAERQKSPPVYLEEELSLGRPSVSATIALLESSIFVSRAK